MNAPTPTGPTVKRHKSPTEYSTPADFIAAVTRRFGRIEWDLAATAENKKAECYFGPDHKQPDSRDALAQDWRPLVGYGGTLWLNPPYDPIRPWTEKVATTRSRAGWTLFLCPSSTGAAWFQENLVPNAYILDLSPRLSFDGKNPFPKDLVLACVGFDVVGRGFWRWKP
jgi:phage N-6-adenine-methyltransferase